MPFPPGLTPVVGDHTCRRTLVHSAQGCLRFCAARPAWQSLVHLILSFTQQTGLKALLQCLQGHSVAELQSEAAYEPVQQKLRLQGMNPEIGHMLLEARGSNSALAPMSAFSSFSTASWNGQDFGVSGGLSCAFDACQPLQCCSCMRIQRQDWLHLPCLCTSASGVATGVLDRLYLCCHSPHDLGFCSVVSTVAVSMVFLPGPLG